MNKIFAVFFIVFIAFQSSWVAASSYCTHEQGTAALHIGHHAHEHKSGDQKLVTPNFSADSASLAGIDGDCNSCLGALSIAFANASLAKGSFGSLERPVQFETKYTSPLAEQLDRPNWPTTL